jgi:hypothetical protein
MYTSQVRQILEPNACRGASYFPRQITFLDRVLGKLGKWAEVKGLKRGDETSKEEWREKSGLKRSLKLSGGMCVL